MTEREKLPSMNRRQAIWALAILVAGGAALAASARKNSVFEPPITPMPAFSPEPSATLIPKATSTGKPEVSVTPEKSQDVEIILTGDVLLGRTVMNESFKLNDPKYPFLKIADTLSQADITFSNLENPIINKDKCPVVPNDARMIFCADPKMLEGLTFAGVDVVTLANNHTLDYGEEGLKETKSFLEERGIDYTLPEKLVTRKVGETTFGFLGFNRVGRIEDVPGEKANQQELDLIKRAGQETDVLIVGVHWGYQYEKHPTDLQRKWARQMVDAGADVIAGHHPHVVQDIDFIDGKPVFYSLGGLVFDNMALGYEETRKGLVARLIYRDGRLIKVEQLPTQIVTWAQTEFVEK